MLSDASAKSGRLVTVALTHLPAGARVRRRTQTIPGLVLDSTWVASIETELTSITVLGDRVESSMLREPGLDIVDPSPYLLD